MDIGKTTTARKQKSAALSPLKRGPRHSGERTYAKKQVESRAPESARDNDFEVKVVVKPVANAIKILRYLSQSRRPEKVTQMARELKVNRSTCFNILRTLVGEGVLDFDPAATTYKIGLGMIKLVENIHTEGERLTAAKPYMHDLSEKFGVNLTLWRRIGLDRMVLASTENSSGDLRIHMRAGQRLPLLLGATGRVAAMHVGMTKAQLRSEFKSLRWARPLSFGTYWREAQEARDRGWSVDDGYFSTGVLAVAAPVLGPSGDVAFSLVAVMFRGQYGEDVITRLGEEMKVTSNHFASLLF